MERCGEDYNICGLCSPGGGHSGIRFDRSRDGDADREQSWIGRFHFHIVFDQLENAARAGANADARKAEIEIIGRGGFRR